MTGAVTAGTAVSGGVAEAMGLGAAESLAVSAGASGWSVSEAGQVVRPAEREGAGVSVAALAGASGPSEMSGVAELIESSVSPADARGGVGT